jgi:hypothetical protein
MHNEQLSQHNEIQKACVQILSYMPILSLHALTTSCTYSPEQRVFPPAVSSVTPGYETHKEKGQASMNDEGDSQNKCP